MTKLELTVISLRYSSWSMRAWLALFQTGASFNTRTVELPLARQGVGERFTPSGAGVSAAEGPDAVVEALRAELTRRRTLGSVNGLFPVLSVDGQLIHETLAICEWAADAHPEAQLWPRDPIVRAQARSLASEMVSGFANLRGQMSCHVAAFVPTFVPDGPTRAEIGRVFELVRDALARSGGPFLFGRFGIADAMYFPVLTRFATYGVSLPPEVRAYAETLSTAPAVVALGRIARLSPALPVYDDYVRGLGGDPGAWPPLVGTAATGTSLC